LLIDKDNLEMSQQDLLLTTYHLLCSYISALEFHIFFKDY